VSDEVSENLKEDNQTGQFWSIIEIKPAKRYLGALVMERVEFSDKLAGANSDVFAEDPRKISLIIKTHSS